MTVKQFVCVWYVCIWSILCVCGGKLMIISQAATPIKKVFKEDFVVILTTCTTKVKNDDFSLENNN